MEPSQVINHLVRTLGVTVHEATTFAETIHEIVEEQVTDDVSVIAPPLILGRFGCPVLDRLFMRLEDPRWSLPESVDVAPEELAVTLRLPVDVIEAYPVVGRFGLLAKLLDRLAVADEDAETYLRMLDAWLDDVRRGLGPRLRGAADRQPRGVPRLAARPVRPAGPLRLPGRASPTRCDDRLDGRAHSFDDGRRPDLIARVTADGDAVRRGDWLVIQHKATAVGHNAHDELAAHVDWLRAELGTRLGNGEVHGLLIADGASLLLERALRERGFGYVSLSALGYRHWVRSHTRVAVVGDPDATSIAYPATIRLGSLTPVAG